MFEIPSLSAKILIAKWDQCGYCAYACAMVNRNLKIYINYFKRIN